MKDFYYRKDIQKILNISRRIIEGYENHGLVEAFETVSGMKHYSIEMVKKAALVRFLQHYGYSLDEIETILLNEKDLKEILIQQIVVLNKKKEETEQMIQIARELLKDENLNCEEILKLFEEGKIQ